MGSAAKGTGIQQQTQQQQQQMLVQASWAGVGVPTGHQSNAGDSTSMGANLGRQTPFSSFHAARHHQQQQQTQQYSTFGSFSQSPVILPSALQPGPGLMPMGSLEALRGGWHAPRGRNAYGDMYGSSLTVPSRQLSLAGSLAGSLGTGSLGVGSMGPPRLPPSLNSYRRSSFSASPGGPHGGLLNSPGMAAASPSMSAAAPNRVYGFGAAAFPDLLQQQAPVQQQQHQLPRQQSLQSRQQATHHRQGQHIKAEPDSADQLLDDWSEQGQGLDGGQLGVPSRQASLDIPYPGDWDPNFRCSQGI